MWSEFLGLQGTLYVLRYSKYLPRAFRLQLCLKSDKARLKVCECWPLPGKVVTFGKSALLKAQPVAFLGLKQNVPHDGQMPLSTRSGESTALFMSSATISYTE
jgi:hypothetical protein